MVEGKVVIAQRHKQISLAFSIYSALLSAAFSIFLVANHAVVGQSELNPWVTLTAAVSFAVQAVVLTYKRPENRIGWLLMLVALLQQSSFGRTVAEVLLVNGAEPTTGLLFWFNLWAPLSAVTYSLLGYIFVIFPNGRLLSPRWRPALWALLAQAFVVAGMVAYLSYDFGRNLTVARVDGVPVALEVLSGVPLPDAILHLRQLPAFTAFSNSLLAAALVIVVAALGSQTSRFRRGNQLERQQIKWVIFAMVLWVLFSVPFIYFPWAATILDIIFVPIVTSAIVVPILRYRLYEIDFIIRKTLIYGVLTAMVALVYSLVVTGTTTALQTQNNAFLTVLALGLAAAAFIPARRRLTHLVNRYLPPPTPPPIEVRAAKTTGDVMDQSMDSEEVAAGRRLVLLSRILLGLAIVWSLTFTVAGIVVIAEGGSGTDLEYVDLFWTLCQILANGIVALLVITRYPRHVVGWLLLSVSFFTALLGFVEGSFFLALQSTQGLASPLAILFGWMARWIWLPIAVTHILFIPQFFPDGRLLSKRWRIPALAAAAGLLVAFVSFAVHPDPLDTYGATVMNPVDIGLDAEQADFLFESIAVPLWLLAAVGAFASLFLRYRRSGRLTRAQMKWVIYALVIWFGLSTGLDLLQTAVPDMIEPVIVALDLENLIVQVGNVVIPLVMGTAILRYRLFDIELIIRRTLIYGVVTASLAAVYFGSVVLLQQLSSGANGEQSPVAIVISTLLIAALFSRLRRRVQEFIDRRFYRAKYDTAQTLAGFAQAARDETDLDALTAELVAVVRSTMQPETVQVWLRPMERRARPPASSMK